MRFVFAILIVLSSSAFAATASVYRLPGSWRDQADRNVSLDQFGGHWTIMTLAYSQCRSVCPMTVENLKSIDEELGATAEKIDFVIFSIDPAKDDPKAMSAFLARNKITGPRWHFLSGDLDHTHGVSAALGMGFGTKSARGAHIMHTFKIALISPAGEVVGIHDAMKIKEISKEVSARLNGVWIH